MYLNHLLNSGAALRPADSGLVDGSLLPGGVLEQLRVHLLPRQVHVPGAGAGGAGAGAGEAGAGAGGAGAGAGT